MRIFQSQIHDFSRLSERLNPYTRGDRHDHQGEHEHDDQEVTPLLSVADFDGDGEVDWNDLRDLGKRVFSSGDDDYHPLYDLDADGNLDIRDFFQAVSTYGEDVPLIDQQIAQATQATMKYYGPDGLQTAIADGYLPFTQAVNGHGIHYFNFDLATEVGNLEELAIERPIGLNYDSKGNLLAVFYIRVPETEEVTPDNPLGNLFVKSEDDFPPSSFETLTADDWHIHKDIWFSGLGNLDPESVYGFEEGVPIEATISRLKNLDFQLFPESDEIFSAKFWMLHGWFHSLNSAGTFANLDPDVALYAPEELGVHAGHHSDSSNPIIAGTDAGEKLFGTDNSDRLNSFAGDDWILGGLGDDSIWGSFGNDELWGDDGSDADSSAGGDDMVYGGPGDDHIYGQAGNDRLFGGTDNDQIWGGEGDDLLRGGLGNDILTGDELGDANGSDQFVLAPGEGYDRITDFELGVDTLVLIGGITPDDLSLQASGSNTWIGFSSKTVPLAILDGVNVTDAMVAEYDVFTVA